MPAQAATTIANHISHNDHWVVLSHLKPNYFAASNVTGIFQKWMSLGGVIFFDRNEPDPAKRNDLADIIKKR